MKTMRAIKELQKAAQEKIVLKNGKTIFSDRAIRAQWALYNEGYSSIPHKMQDTSRLSDEK